MWRYNMEIESTFTVQSPTDMWTPGHEEDGKVQLSIHIISTENNKNLYLYDMHPWYITRLCGWLDKLYYLRIWDLIWGFIFFLDLLTSTFDLCKVFRVLSKYVCSGCVYIGLTIDKNEESYVIGRINIFKGCRFASKLLIWKICKFVMFVTFL